MVRSDIPLLIDLGIVAELNWERTLGTLRGAKFEGFRSIGELQRNVKGIPSEKGVYIVLRESGRSPRLRKPGTGGHFKGRDPNAKKSTLRKNWVSNAHIIYIGKAGHKNQRATLQTRICAYLQFGKGNRAPHWGGRYIWQLRDREKLLVKSGSCWINGLGMR